MGAGSERERESAQKQFTRNSPRRAFGDWIHSYLSPWQSVPDCNPSPSFPHTAATSIATTTPFRSAPATSICLLSAFPSAGLRYRPPSSLPTRRERETARSHGNFKHHGDSSVLFPRSSVLLPLYPVRSSLSPVLLSLTYPPRGRRNSRAHLTDMGTRHNAVTARFLCYLRPGVPLPPPAVSLAACAKIGDIIGRLSR